MNRNQLFRLFLVVSMFLVADLSMTSCRSSYCPGVDGTGNSASRGGGRRLFGRSDCPAVKGTGNFKPKVKRKKEDGLMSPKQKKTMAKANEKKAGPIKKQKLSFD